MRDGQYVSYIGTGVEGLSLGDRGQILQTSTRSSHVLWTTGSCAGQVTLADHYDISPVSKKSPAVFDPANDDSLDLPSGMRATAIREIYDTEGESGILNWMSEQGSLGSFQAIAEEALTYIASRIRQDASFRVVASNLDEDESENLIQLAASVLLRDAFGEVG